MASRQKRRASPAPGHQVWPRPIALCAAAPLRLDIASNVEKSPPMGDGRDDGARLQDVAPVTTADPATRSERISAVFSLGLHIIPAVALVAFVLITATAQIMRQYEHCAAAPKRRPWAN